MNRTQINSDLFTYMNDFKATAKRHTNNEYDADDLLSSVVEYFLNMSDERVLEIFEKDGLKGLRNYIGASIKRSATSNKSKYYYTIRKASREYETDIATYTDEEGRVINPLENIAREEDNTLDELSDMLRDILETEIGWYERKLFEMHKIEGIGLTEIAEMTDISRNSIYTTITNTMSKLRTIAKQREMEKERLEDYGILSTEDYNNKYRIYMTPDISFFQLKTLLEECRGDKTVAMSYFQKDYATINYHCKKWGINITRNSHITKELIEEALIKNNFDNTKTAHELEISSSAIGVLIKKRGVNTNELKDTLLVSS